MDKVTEKLQERLHGQPMVLKWLPEMNPETIADGIFEGMSDENYNKIDAIRATELKTFVNYKGDTFPGKYYAKYIFKPFQVMLDEMTGDKDVFVIGNKVHERTLFGTTDFSTHPALFKEGDKKRIKNRQIVELCAASLLARPTFRNLLEGSYRELVVVVTCPVTGLRLKAKMDIVDSDLQTVTDIKTTGNMAELISPAEWKSGFLIYGYPIQEQHYLYVANLGFGDSLFGAERKMIFAAVEKGKDYDVEFLQTKADKREGYKEIYFAALKELASRIKQDNWFDEIKKI